MRGSQPDDEPSIGGEGQCDLCGGNGWLYDLAARIDVPCECMKDRKPKRKSRKP